MLAGRVAFSRLKEGSAPRGREEAMGRAADARPREKALHDGTPRGGFHDHEEALLRPSAPARPDASHAFPVPGPAAAVAGSRAAEAVAERIEDHDLVQGRLERPAGAGPSDRAGVVR